MEEKARHDQVGRLIELLHREPARAILVGIGEDAAQQGDQPLNRSQATLKQGAGEFVDLERPNSRPQMTHKL